MASIVKIKRSSVQGKAPTISDIQAGELALNTRDGKLFSSDGSIVFEIGANLHSLSVGTGGLTIGNGAFTFPTSDGANNQVIVTNGAGTLAWANAASGGLSEEEVLELLPFTTGFTISTIPPRDLRRTTTVDGALITTANTDAFGVSLYNLYECMEPTGRIESVDFGVLA